MFSRTTHCGFGVQPADVTLRCENICLGITPLSRSLNAYCVQGCTNSGFMEESILWQGKCWRLKPGESNGDVKGNQRDFCFCKHHSFWPVPSSLVGYTYIFSPSDQNSPPQDFQSEGNKRNSINIFCSWPIGEH